MGSKVDTAARNKAGKEKGRKGKTAIVPAVLLIVGGILYFTSDGHHCRKYLKLAEKCYKSEKYEEALEYCDVVLELDDTITEAYRLSSDIYLAQDKCEEAVRALMDGVAAIEAKELAEREEYLRENIVVVRSESIYYNEDGSVSRTVTVEYEYDEKGNKTKEVFYKADGSVSGWYEYEYDERGNPTKYVKHNVDGCVYSWWYEYDERGNLTKVVFYEADGSISGWYEYEYDERDNQTKWVYYSADGSASGWAEYEYDERDNQTKWAYYRADGRVWWYEYEYEYDERGNQTIYVEHSAYGSESSWWYEYDERGNKTKAVKYREDGSVQILREYDERGNETKYVSYEADGSVGSQAEYEYNVLNSMLSSHSWSPSNSFSDHYTAIYQYHYIGD